MGLNPRLVDTYWAKGAANMVCQDAENKGLLEKQVPNMAAWEMLRLKVLGIHALPTYKIIVA
jgi:hypothetical protein